MNTRSKTKARKNGQESEDNEATDYGDYTDSIEQLFLGFRSEEDRTETSRDIRTNQNNLISKVQRLIRINHRRLGCANSRDA